MNPDLLIGDTAQEDRGRQPVHGLRRARHRHHPTTPTARSIVEVKGVDVYDPTTGQIRSSSTDDIACWFIDTDYNGESFFVRHAYFTRGRRPLRKAQARPAGRDRRGRMVGPLQHQEPPLRHAGERQDRRQGDQPLRRRGVEGLRGLKSQSFSPNFNCTVLPLRLHSQCGGLAWAGQTAAFRSSANSLTLPRGLRQG